MMSTGLERMDGINREQGGEQQQEQQDPQQQQQQEQPQQEELPLQQRREQLQQRHEQLVEQRDRAWRELVDAENGMARLAAERFVLRERQVETVAANEQATAAQASADSQAASQPVQLRFQPFVPSRAAQQQWDEEMQQLPELQRRQQRRQFNEDDWITEGEKWFVLPEPNYPAGRGMDWAFIGIRTNPKDLWACCHYKRVPAEAPARTWRQLYLEQLTAATTPPPPAPIAATSATTSQSTPRPKAEAQPTAATATTTAPFYSTPKPPPPPMPLLTAQQRQDVEEMRQQYIVYSAAGPFAVGPRAPPPPLLP